MKRRAQFCCDASRDMNDTKQSGGAMPVFVGVKRQRGHGLGSMLSSLFRNVLVPFLKKRGYISRKRAKDGTSGGRRRGARSVIERDDDEKAHTRSYKKDCTRNRLADWLRKAKA